MTPITRSGTTPRTTSATVVSTRRGGPETLSVVATTVPSPGAGEAVVRVEAAGVSFGDILLARGVIPGAPRPPFTPGFDLAGTVVALGDGVTDLRVGDRVAALVKEGAYAEHACVPADRLVPLPAGVDPVTASAVALDAFIAHQMLFRVARVGIGSRILVHGASGGVGLAFCQLARRADVEVWGTASAGKLGMLEELGVHALDYRRDDPVSAVLDSRDGAVDAVFDAVGGDHFRRSYRAVRRGGILVAYGQSAAVRDGEVSKAVGAKGFLLGIVAPKLVPDGRRTTFYNAWSLEKSTPTAYREDLAHVLGLLASGELRPVLADTLPLALAGDAQQRLENRTVTGKLVLVP